VLQYEACVARPAAELRKTYEFLGLDTSFVPEEPAGQVGTKLPQVELTPRMRSELAGFYAVDVASLSEAFPEIDPGLWPNFAGQH
jgi:hypothetical protein